MFALFADSGNSMLYVVLILLAIFVFGLLIVGLRFYRKVHQGEAFVRTGVGGTRVSFGGMLSFPIIHRLEDMDISVKRIEIFRHGAEGLICKDNMRADIKVAFFVGVNKEADDVLKVALQLGCDRASQESALLELFDPKFSEALKTVGKQFDFVELYVEREKFRDEILKQIGEDLNGYKLENAHIDYLEQTPKDMLNPTNILDAEGIKKITQLTTGENIKRNHFDVEEAKQIKRQNVERDETLYELERQRVEAEQKQQREIAAVTAREQAEAEKVRQEQRNKAEQARISTDESVQVAEENKDRQIIVADLSKQRTLKVETERVEKDRELENTERRRTVSVAEIEKDKVVETENKHLQDVVRERVMVERKVVEEEQKIIDTEQFAGADRSKRVQVTKAEEEAQQALVKQVKAAEAEKTSAELLAQKVVIEAEADREAAEKETHAKKMLAEATTAETAAPGLGDARVIVAKADASEKQGFAEANVQKAKAESLEKEGLAEATVMKEKFQSEADGITEKAKSMKLFHQAGKEHEEFKLRLNKDKDVELAAIGIQKDIAEEQAKVVGQALETARIDIVGGDTEFFDRIVNSVTGGKVVDRYIGNSHVLQDIKQTFFNGDPEYFKKKLDEFFDMFNLDTADVKNISIAALIGKMISMSDSADVRSELEVLLDMAEKTGLADRKASTLRLGKPDKAK
ncbi:MAG: SPFH domain-containing protein [Pirellulales bacterium]